MREVILAPIVIETLYPIWKVQFQTEFIEGLIWAVIGLFIGKLVLKFLQVFYTYGCLTCGKRK